jgi:photosystem II stability/assembly factor-like uncharacterized protein
VDTLNGWAGGVEGQLGTTFKHTTDGGNNWVDQAHPGPFYIRDIYFGDTLNGWVISDGLSVYRTTDGGQTWDTCAPILSDYSGYFRLSAVRLTPDHRTLWGVGYQGVIVTSTDGGSNWLYKSTHLTADISNIKFANRQIGYTCGDRILKTTNGGRQWAQLSVPYQGYWGSLNVFDSLTLFVSSPILKTTDGGETWLRKDSSIHGNVRTFFLNSDLGWAFGEQRTLWRTTDGGDYWDSLVGDFGLNIEGFFFSDSLVGWMVGNGGSVWKTSDAGRTWLAMPAAGSKHQLHSIVFLSPRIGWIAGESSLLKTTDGGTSWTRMRPDDHSTQYWKVNFIDSVTGWTATNYGLMATTDGGVTWIILDSPMGNASTFDFVDNNNGWIANQGLGGILHTTTGGLTAIKDRSYLLPSKFILLQNYPNPFNPSTTIKYTLPSLSIVKLEVFNMLGQRVSKLVDEREGAGYYQQLWLASNVASGIYLYRLEAVDVNNPSKSCTQVKKMLLIK